MRQDVTFEGRTEPLQMSFGSKMRLPNHHRLNNRPTSMQELSEDIHLWVLVAQESDKLVLLVGMGRVNVELAVLIRAKRERLASCGGHRDVIIY